ncbi:MAG: putative sulfate/molybdate transporter [Clostridia bacterium]|nr:putative sulfate/molybdate transporter [Clostridia bacterium]
METGNSLGRNNLAGEKTSQVVGKSRVLGEISGALGDLGTFLPHVLGAITVAGFKPTGIFTMFGLFYLATGLFYRLPVAVQPMKAASAVILVEKVTPGEMAGAAIIIGLTLLILGVTGLIGVLARIIPRTVVAGIQLGLGVGLALLGLKMIAENLLIGVATLLVMIPLGFNRRLPQALVGIGTGIVLALFLGQAPSWPQSVPSLYLPEVTWPSWSEVGDGLTKIALPQLTLTLTNAIIVTSTLAGQLFPGSNRVNPVNLALTQGLANILAGPLGGFPMCHGGGGMAAHHRFGARTGLAPVLLGLVLLTLGLFYGEAGVALLKFIPAASLGALLFYSGLDLALGGQLPENRQEFFVILVVAALVLGTNPALALLVGLIIAWVKEKNLLQP